MSCQVNESSRAYNGREVQRAILYKWLNGREATHSPGFRYRLGRWTPPIRGNLIPCQNAYHGVRVDQLAHWIARDLYVIESRSEWCDDSDKLYTRGPVRIVEHLKGWNERTARLFAADCAERVLPLWERGYPDDDRPRKAIQAARDYANGLIGSEEADQAYTAAHASAYAAAHAAHASAYAAAHAALASAYAAAHAAHASAYTAAHASAAAYASAHAAHAAHASAYTAARAAAAADAAYTDADPYAVGYTAAAAAADAEREWQGRRILDYAHGRIS